MTPPYNCITNVFATSDVDSWFPSTVIPVVADDTARDAMFPSPTTNQRVENIDSGMYEMWDGSAWMPDVVRAPLLAGDTGASLVGFLQSGTGAVGRTMESKANDQYVTPFDFGASDTPGADNTTAIVAMCNSGARRFDFLDREWKVTVPNNAAMVTFTSQSGIRIRGAGATIYNPRVHVGDPFAPIFDFVGCQDVECVGMNYRGVAHTVMSQQGGTFIRWRNGSDTLRVDAEVRFARYGVLSGNYSDETQGNCRDMHLKLKGYDSGYPVALYWVTNFSAEIYAERIHRAAYLAGVDGGGGIVNVQWKDQEAADIVVLLTDAKTGTGTQVGCRDMTVNSYDLGSTQYESSTVCCGIANSRVGPVTIHENLAFNFRVKSDDSLSTQVGGFKVASGTLPGGEPYYWEPTTILRNIKVSGIIDRTGQTDPAGTVGDFYWDTLDTGVHTATVQNIDFSDITIIPGSAPANPLVITATGLLDRFCLNRVSVGGTTNLYIATNTSSDLVFNDCKIPEIQLGGTVGSIRTKDSTIGKIQDAATGGNAYKVENTVTGGASAILCMKQVVLELSGPSVNWSAAIPAGSLIVGVTSRVQTAITGATGYTIGVAGDLARYASIPATAAGTTSNGSNYALAETAPRLNLTGAATIVVTAATSNFTGGTLKLVLFYYSITAPTS